MLERLNSYIFSAISISTARTHFNTALHEEQVRLLVHSLSEEEGEPSPSEWSDIYNTGIERRTVAMVSRDGETKTSTIEAHAVGAVNESSYRKSTDDFGTNTQISNSVGREVEEIDAGITREDLAVAIQVIEGKKHGWYAYFTTKDFWAVLVLGYILPLVRRLKKSTEHC